VLSNTSEFEGALSFEVALVIDIVLGVFWIPVRVTELIFFLEILLWSPEFFTAIRLLLGWDWSHIFWDIHLILSHHVMNSGIHFVLEEGEWHTEIVIWMHSDWQLTRNRIPRIFVHFPNWGVSKDHHSHYKTIGVDEDLPTTEDYYATIKSAHSNPPPPLYNMRHIHPCR
jgi:hypothetical protein